ncbi:GNAT family N-acetyltransferase [Rhizobium cremeum]|uniref:GNAT family N-acetyltransferase n=1 Tax=Rhizobium cremeum TaxID=2813827 RepID=UPI001FD43CA5|nr:GNAT family N-acetyltransferase [Rhizobium cremeum]MCJ7996589.1 GNAT family N-acetyltransferase [Rhizobium cremeum]MCJ7999313.1 GNAT family N-acetyltransferase [Rhizobium cremeum]
MQIEITLAEHSDIDPWMLLAEQVTPLFGPMPHFEAILLRKIAQKQAYCARIGANITTLIGGVLIGGAGREHWIRWLAVSSEYRRLGVGRMLVEKAISVIPANSSIYVDTFVGGSAEADAANRFYQTCGFAPTEVCQMNDLPRQRYMRPPSVYV